MDDAAKLKQLFKVTQAVMKSRHEQVEEAMDEMEKEAKQTKKKGTVIFCFTSSVEVLWAMNPGGEKSKH